MDEQGTAAVQARLLRKAIDCSGMGLHEVWMHYFSIGGNVGEIEVEAFLHHALPLPVLERDLLAHAVNELVDHRPVLRAPYASEIVVDVQETGSDGQETGFTDESSLNPDPGVD